VTAVKREAAAGMVRGMIADGTLVPGAPAPSGAALARKTGFGTLTCRRALEMLLADGTLTRGVSPTARLRVAQRGGSAAGNADALRVVALSKSLAGRRHAAGLTQPELAEKLGVSLTTVGHAETGRVWQSREFWRQADALLDGFGDLLRMFDGWQAAKHAAPAEMTDEAPLQEKAVPVAPAAPVLPVSVTITAAGVSVVWPDGTETLARPAGQEP